jgi:hypothetical protein
MRSPALPMPRQNLMMPNSARLLLANPMLGVPPAFQQFFHLLRQCLFPTPNHGSFLLSRGSHFFSHCYIYNIILKGKPRHFFALYFPSTLSNLPHFCNSYPLDNFSVFPSINHRVISGITLRHFISVIHLANLGKADCVTARRSSLVRVVQLFLATIRGPLTSQHLCIPPECSLPATFFQSR